MGSYLDTSFLIKIYTKESRSEEAANLIQNKPFLFISSFVEVEMACTFHRLNEVETARKLFSRFKTRLDLGDYLSLPIVPDIFLRAQVLADRFSAQLKLRSLDAIHLATALHYDADELATYDTRLAEAATLSGLQVIPART